MRITYFIITLAICFCTSLFAENKANDLMKQAQNSLEQKDFTKETIRKPLIVEQKRHIFITAKTTIRKRLSFADK